MSICPNRTKMQVNYNLVVALADQHMQTEAVNFMLGDGIQTFEVRLQAVYRKPRRSYLNGKIAVRYFVGGKSISAEDLWKIIDNLDMVPVYQGQVLNVEAKLAEVRKESAKRIDEIHATNYGLYMRAGQKEATK